MASTGYEVERLLIGSTRERLKNGTSISGRGFTTKSKTAWIVLDDGTSIKGKAFGYQENVVGEVVFTTGMVGYTKSLTDPSYKGQILMFTYPLIGNYGVPSFQNVDVFGLPRFFESDSIKAQGTIVHEYCEQPSHWASIQNINEWLTKEKVPGIYDVDTRSLTQKIRVKGVMMGAIVADEKPDEGFRMLQRSTKYGEINFVGEVSTKSPKIYGRGEKTLVLVDYGTKYNILRSLLVRGFKVIILPYDSSIDEILDYDPDGIVLSNGPGDPKQLKSSVKVVGQLLNEYRKPILGICLGNQILSLAAGADTYKLKFGHRGQNKPTLDLASGKCYIVSENHGYAVDEQSLKRTEFQVWLKNIDDDTVEGLRHKTKPIISTQFHPEASPGPYDTTFIFDTFKRMVNS
ncbi:MAG: glutamine-hydrolyzing carbamoyl-phosphate synthase small subunit [Nitrososphaeria archaeon]